MENEQYKTQLRKSIYAGAIAVPLFILSSCYALASDGKYSKLPLTASTALVLASITGVAMTQGKKTIDDFVDKK